jgi:ATP-dependent RNA helicase DHX8/PRP22
MADADIYSLELLSLVNKITQELNNHTGYNDKTLAEFIISIHDDSKTLPEFKSKLSDCGAAFPDAFVENVDRLILSLHPKHKKKVGPLKNASGATNGAVEEDDKRRRLFPGLAIKDQDVQGNKDVLMKEVDDMMAQFETTAKRQPARREEEPSPKRQRRDRSRSPRRPSPGPPPTRGHDDRRNDRGRGRHNDRGRPTLDERPILYKIYDGRVQSLKDFGAFVQLEGLAGRFEGTLSFFSFFMPYSLWLRTRSCVKYSNWSPYELCVRFVSPQPTSQGQSYVSSWHTTWTLHEGRRPGLRS